MYEFERSGVTVLQLKSLSAEFITEEVCQLVDSFGSIDAPRLAHTLGISLVLASERFEQNKFN